MSNDCIDTYDCILYDGIGKKLHIINLTEKSQNNTTYKQLTPAFIGDSQTILKIKLIEKKKKNKKITRTFSWFTSTETMDYYG